MESYQGEEIDIYNSLLLDELPRNLLNIISDAINISEGVLVGHIVKQFPRVSNIKMIRKKCASSIRWFLHNGDITSSGRKNYVIIPPYGIYRKTEDKKVIQLCGNINLDEKISGCANSIGAVFITKLVSWHWEIAEKKEAPNVGYRREIYLNGNHSVLLGRLQKLNIPVVNTEDISRKLPSINDLRFYPKGYLDVDIPKHGKYYFYDAESEDLDRWKSLEEKRSNHILLCWKSSLDWRGDRDARYFYRIAEDEHYEISKSNAYLWAFHFDNKMNNRKPFWVFEQNLWVPRHLPEAHKHYLKLVSKDWHKEGILFRYYLQSDPDAVTSIIQNSLNLKLNRSSPKKMYSEVSNAT